MCSPCRFDDVVENVKPATSRSDLKRSDDDAADDDDLIQVSDGLDEHQAKLLEGALAARIEKAGSDLECSNEEVNSFSSDEDLEAEELNEHAKDDEDEPSAEEGAPACTPEASVAESRTESDGENSGSGSGELRNGLFFALSMLFLSFFKRNGAGID